MNIDLKTLRKRLYKATPLPWTEQCLGGRELGDAGLMAELESVSSPFSRSSHADDLAFAVAAINSLPALLDIAELAQGVCEHDPLLYDVRLWLREAINKFNNKAQGNKMTTTIKNLRKRKVHVSTSEFTRGFYCAVAALIKMHWADTESRELAHLGGDLLDADQEDREVITRAFPEFASKKLGAKK